VQGETLAWSQVLDGGQLVQLPTYAFQRTRYWLDAGSKRQDARAMGMQASEHPLLGAQVHLADSDGYVFSSRVSLHEHAWLRDHRVHGQVMMPGTAWLELALYAAQQVGLSRVSELMLEQPCVLSEEQSLQLQVSVGALEDGQARSIQIFSRLQNEGAAWERNASGTLAAEDPNRAEAQAAAFEQLPGLGRLVDAGQDHRLGMMADQGRDRPLLLFLGVAAVQHQDLEAARQEGVVQSLQVFDEDAVGQRRNHHADDMRLRGSERACEVVWNISKLSHRSIDAPPHVVGNHFRFSQCTRNRDCANARARSHIR